MSLPWDTFSGLGGSPERNFELLWRGVVQRHWGRFGVLRSVRQQPGVEFHLRLEDDCDLGEAGRWFGWQCRWYELRQNNGFRASQKTGIKESIRRTVEYLPDLTDYVLCLKKRPSATDIEWFHGLTADEVGVDPDCLPRLHLEDEEDLEPRLTGDAAVFRETFFGELIATPEQLDRSRARSLSPVKERWMPDVNVETHVESDVKVALLRPQSFAFLADQAEFLATLHNHAEPGDDCPADLESAIGEVREGFTLFINHLGRITDAVNGRDPGFALELIREDLVPPVTPIQVRQLARSLRRIHHPAALAISTAEAAFRKTRRLLTEARALGGASLIAIVGDPGKGKSHFSAEVTAPGEHSLAGVFIAGRDLKRGATLDDLVSRLPELKVDRIDDLLEMLDAVGARAGERVPVVIDGLNEAERPHEWQAQLAGVEPALGRFPNVVLLVTLRGAVADDVLIPEAHELNLRWKTEETSQVVGLYLTHYKIDPGSSRLPGWLLADPLFLRLFCEAVNSERTEWVGAESIPDDLVSVYELFRSNATQRFARQLNLRPALVARKLAAVATALWERQARDLPFEEVQEILEEDEREWESSLVRAFEQEGILSRKPDENWEDQRTSILFDRFAGFLIADALLEDRTPGDAEELLTSPRFWGAIAGELSRRHPLADDILVALTGVIPRRLYGRQLWHFAPDDLKDMTLKMSIQLSSHLIDDETQAEVADYIAHRSGSPGSFNVSHAFDHLWDFHDSPGHRLNAKFLDRVLRLMPMARRDACWTEWLRARTTRVARSVGNAASRWSISDVRGPRDDDQALAFVWIATSTDRKLRDYSSVALQRFGRGDPRGIFELAINLGEIDDPYVTERVLGACVGSALTQQMPDPGGGFRSALRNFLAQLTLRYIDPGHSPTSHVLIRDHVRTLFAFAAKLHPDAIPAETNPNELSFIAGPQPEALEEESAAGKEVDETLGLDFSNYTVGSLYEERGNYDYDHVDWLRGLQEIRGRVWELGWRAELFGEIDKRIAEDGWRRGRSDDDDRTERYGKKYGWIAYYELASRLDEAGLLRRRDWYRNEVPHGFDPTFPTSPSRSSIELPHWASQLPIDDREWYESGVVEIPEELVTPAELDGDEGPWILVAGRLSHRDSERRREVWANLGSFLAEPDVTEEVRATLEDRPYLGNHSVPEPPSDAQTYAGEMPWSDSFLERGELGWGDPPYMGRLGRLEDEGESEVEILAHEYGIDSGALVLSAKGCYVPSALIAKHFDLRQRPGMLDLVGLDGRPASRTFLAPEGFGGNLLYIRRDLVADYAGDRELVQLAWGERQVSFDWQSRPGWFTQTANHADVWRYIDVLRFQ